MRFFVTAHCRSRAHCVACRTSPAWRRSLVATGLADAEEFECPEGLTAETAADRRKGLRRLPSELAHALPSLEELTAEDLAAFRAEERRRRREVGGCCGSGAAQDAKTASGPFA